MEKELVKDAGLLKKVCNVLDILGISNFFTSDKSDKSHQEVGSMANYEFGIRKC